MKLFISTFTKNEFRTILGNRNTNFWILLAVFVCSIGALEFSRAGMVYLRAKMNDPFIKWIEIQNRSEEFDAFRSYMREPENMERYGIEDYEETYFLLEQVIDANKAKRRYEGRTIEYDSKLLDRILDSENIVVPQDNKIEVTGKSYGWIVTEEMLESLGYTDSKEYPLFLDVATTGIDSNISAWGLSTERNSNWVSYPVPILAVVRQLPNLLDFMTPRMYYFQHEASTKPFNISWHEDYFNDIILIATDTAGVAAAVKRTLDEQGVNYDRHLGLYENYRDAFRPAYRLRIVVYDTMLTTVNQAVRRVCDSVEGLYRVYDYAFLSMKEYDISTDYISFMFKDPGEVSKFADTAKTNYGVHVDMTQIEAKENFKTFNILATVLCIAIMILSALFMSIFLWFLIDSHFRAIARNLGTIMAFGLPNRTIMQIYSRVFLRMVLCSLALAVGFLGCLELTLSVCGVVRQGGGHYIILNDPWVWVLIAIIPIITAIVVYFTIRGKLKAKPGDLIFERTN